MSVPRRRDPTVLETVSAQWMLPQLRGAALLVGEAPIIASELAWVFARGWHGCRIGQVGSAGKSGVEATKHERTRPRNC